MSSSTAVIVGAAGFIGRHLTATLSKGGWRCIGCDLVTQPPDWPGEYRQVDLRRGDPQVPEGCDVVIFLAQDPSYRVLDSRTPELFAVNSLAPMRWALAGADRDCRLFLYASTGSIYRPSFEPLDENAPLHRNGAYALSKIMGEECLALLSERLQTLSLRFFGVYGAGQRNMLVPTILSRLQANEPITLAPRADGRADQDGLRISLTHVDDVCRAIVELIAMGHTGALPWSAVNVACDQPASLRELAERAGALIGSRPRFEVATAPRAGDLIADIGRFRGVLQTPFRPLSKGLEEVVGEAAETSAVTS